MPPMKVLKLQIEQAESLFPVFNHCKSLLVIVLILELQLTQSLSGIRGAFERLANKVNRQH